MTKPGNSDYSFDMFYQLPLKWFVSISEVKINVYHRRLAILLYINEYLFET